MRQLLALLHRLTNRQTGTQLTCAPPTQENITFLLFPIHHGTENRPEHAWRRTVRRRSNHHGIAALFPSPPTSNPLFLTYILLSPLQEVSYNAPRDSHSDPQYTAAQLAPALDILSAHQSVDQRRAAALESQKVQQLLQQLLFAYHPSLPHGGLNSSPTTLMNPFVLSTPASLALWNEARAALSHPPYFYTTMRKYGSTANVLKRGDETEVQEERFPVRVREITLKVEQGLADLRMLLAKSLRDEDAEALEALRDNIKVALAGL